MNINTDKSIDIIRVLSNDYVAFANQTITGSSSAQSLTVPADTKYALIVPESTTTGACIRYWMDGKIPTISVGLPKQSFEAFDVTGANNLANFKFILASATAANITIEYFK